jgi:hypothetical protein
VIAKRNSGFSRFVSCRYQGASESDEFLHHAGGFVGIGTSLLIFGYTFGVLVRRMVGED